MYKIIFKLYFYYVIKRLVLDMDEVELVIVVIMFVFYEVKYGLICDEKNIKVKVYVKEVLVWINIKY